MDLQELHNRLKQLTPERMESLVLTFVKANQNALVDYNTQQLMRGLDSLGKPLDPPYASAAYAELKLHLNPRGVVDLKLTGDFHESIFVDANKFPIIFRASDKKAPQLLEDYGEDILGVQEMDLEEFIFSLLLPDLQNATKNILQL